MDEPGSETREMIDAHCRRGGKALVLNPSERGEMIVVKHGPREMQLAWTHLLPATFAGRARMNVQNALAAAAAAFAAGAPLHDIRQGLRSFSTNYYLAPGRLNEVEVSGVNVIVDYCHNAPGMKMLGDFVDRVGESLESSHELARPSRIGIIATAGDRRDEDMRELGHIAAQHFDVVIVREDANTRGRERGEVAALVTSGVRAAMDEGIARCKQVEEVLDEIEAVRHAMSRANKGDLVVICVDKHAAVMTELENWAPQAQAGAGVTSDAPAADPDYVPAEPAPADA
jgi:cyanophycin synthetase